MPPTAEHRSNLQLLDSCARKLKELVQLVMADSVGKEDIVPSLLNSSQLLEKMFVDRTKGRGCEEQEEELFSVADEQEVPDKVQEWLTNTFTRRASLALPRRRRLRSLATVIQTGVFFDKLFRSRASLRGQPALPIPHELHQLLQQAALAWDFDPFVLADRSDGRPVRMIGLHLFHHFGLIEKFSIELPALEAFLDFVEEGYRLHGNPYHNCTHAADVAQTCAAILHHHRLVSWLTDLELLSLLFAAVVHDFEHNGTTNNFHVQTRSELALVYNDRSVLESHHVSAVFRGMLRPQSQCNILAGLGQAEYRQFRQLAVDMVLATDMSMHFAQVHAMKDAAPCPENLPRADILAYILHAADISHPAKDWRLHQRWSQLLTQEFFAQGDREKQLGLPCSPLCDRDATLVASSQVGFIEYIVQPCFHTLQQLLQSVQQLLEPTAEAADDERQEWAALQAMEANRLQWKELAEQQRHRIDAISEAEEEADED